ncbi:MAG: aminoacyl-tRNA hydrolase [Chloroflexota bacterium]|nr:aminoacyl-tRNA hydrolase [Dehalococcoidia bacterium]MDW8255020.1 aminoacyl-tRNA hydrolase [Chloroflexota bacterium]
MLVVGLGNPGKRYAHNRHNVGFMVVDAFAERHGLRFSRKRGKAEIADGAIGEQRVLLAKPQTYVNLSGEAVQALQAFTKLEPERILVVCDDLDLPLGTLRLREQGGSGGHNGLKSIAQRLGTTKFPRLRIGIGRPPEEERLGRRDEIVTAHVLGNFSSDERVIINEAIARAVAAIETAILEGIPAAMNRFNQPGRGAAPEAAR